jgi:hypothetical protein
MSKRRSLRTLIWGVSSGLLATLGCAVANPREAASGVGGPEAPLAASLCPSCQATAGGETSDFPGTAHHACARANHILSLDEREADALAFVDVAELKARLEHEIDVAMRWTAQPTERALVEGGYEADTRLHATTKIVSYTYYGPNPALCAGGLCTLAGSAESFEPCSEVLRIGTEVELRTDDGAVTASLEGSTLLDSALDLVELNNNAFGDLTDAHGTLRIGTEASQPVSGELHWDVIYGALPGQTRGHLRVVLSFAAQIRSIDDFDLPIWGGWGPAEDEPWAPVEDELGAAEPTH